MSVSITRSHTKFNTYKKPKPVKQNTDAQVKPPPIITVYRRAPEVQIEVVPQENPRVLDIRRIGREVKEAKYSIKHTKGARPSEASVLKIAENGQLLNDLRGLLRTKLRMVNSEISIRAQELFSQSVQDKRISELQLATELDVNDLIAVVDRSDLTMAASGTTKAAQLSLLSNYLINILEQIVTYTNAVPVPEDIGGISAGTTFSNATIQEMFDALLYPYQVPSFSSFSMVGQVTNVEVGDSISGSQTFVWNTANPSNIETNSITIRDVNAAIDLATGLSNDGNETLILPSAVQLLSPGSYVWRIIGEDTQSSFFQRNFTVNWLWRRYSGTSNSTTLTESDIESLASSGLSSTFSGNYSYAAGGYKYICYPTTLGDITHVYDTDTNFPIAMATSVDDAFFSNVANGINYGLVNVTNSFGQTIGYRVYRTKYILGSTITISVS